MTVCWGSHFAGRHEEAVRETRRTRELSPHSQKLGNLLIAMDEHLGRFEDAAHLAFEQPIVPACEWGRQRALLSVVAIGRRGDAYWRKRISFLDDSLSVAPAIHYGYAVLYSHLGETERAIHHLEQLVDARSSNAVFIFGVDPCLAVLRADARFQRLLTRLGVPTASAPHTVLDVVIGTGTPARAARRTTDPWSASTSIRLPWERSISSDDRMLPGMFAHIPVHPLDHI